MLIDVISDAGGWQTRGDTGVVEADAIRVDRLSKRYALSTRTSVKQRSPYGWLRQQYDLSVWKWSNKDCFHPSDSDVSDL